MWNEDASISAAPDPGFFLNQTSGENSDHEAQCINFETLTDDEVSDSDATRFACPFIDYEATESDVSPDDEPSRKKACQK